MDFLYASVYLFVKICMLLPYQTFNFELPEELYEHCPYTDICNRTALKSLHVTGMVPCCSSCKCDDQCGLRLDCCFDHQDRYRLKEKGIIACINPVTRGEKLHSFQSYWMVQSCMKMTEAVPDNTTITCKMYNKKGHSLVEPVSAKEKGDIYINADCAKCNNVHNFTRWNYSFVARFQPEGSLVWEIGNSLKNRLGAIAYFPPKEEDWSMKRCFNTIHDTCPINSTFERLCKHLQSTYQSINGVHYKNIFCFTCAKQGRVSSKCIGGKEKNPFTGFTILIDNSLIEYTKLLKTVMSIKRLKTWCLKVAMSSDVDPCFAILCPEGMLRVQTGCEYFIRRLEIPSFQIQFKLRTKAGKELPVAFIKALTNEERNTPSLWMKLPCYEVNPTLTEVFYETGDVGSETTVKSFIVRLFKLTPTGFNPSTLIPNLQKCLKYNWYIQIFGDTYLFHATMDKYTYYVQDGEQILQNHLSKVHEDVAKPKLFDSITDPSLRGQYWRYRVIAIRKTFFCNQVRLPLHSVEELAGEIRIPSRNITLGDNEYVMNFYKTDTSTYDHNKSTVSVCLEDLDDMYQERSMSLMSVKKLQLETLVLFCAIIWLLI